MPRTKTLAAAALSAIALTGVAAQAASADSIAYLKGGDVWLSTPDGSRHFQVTSTGGYTSVTQSDDGTLAALTGERIHRLDRLGNVLADFKTAVSDGYTGGPMYGASHFEGPFDIDLSPDGTKLAYNFYWQQWTWYGGGSYSHSLRQGVGVSHSDRNTSWEELGYQTGWVDSDWYDNDTLLLSSEASDGMMDTATVDIGQQNTGSKDWFWFDQLKTMRRAAVNRQHTMVAEVADYQGAAHLDVWTMTGEAPALPTYCLGIGDPAGGAFEHIAWSPDGKRMLYEDGAGIHVLIPECDDTKEPTLLIPGGTDPDWGAADVPASRPAPPAPPSPPAPPAPPAPKPELGLTVKPGTRTTDGGSGGTKRATRRTTAVASIACRRRCTVTGKVVVPSKLAKRLRLKKGATLATGKARRSKKGTVKLTLKPSAAGRKALSKLEGVKLRLRVTIKEGGKTRRLTKTVTLA